MPTSLEQVPFGAAVAKIFGSERSIAARPLTRRAGRIIQQSGALRDPGPGGNGQRIDQGVRRGSSGRLHTVARNQLLISAARRLMRMHGRFFRLSLKP